MKYDFSICKFCEAPGAVPKYRLRGDIRVYHCGSCGGHYIDYLDGLTIGDEAGVPTRTSVERDEGDFLYIERKLQSNRERFESQVKLVFKYLGSSNVRLLDVGAGGGLFLALLKEQGVKAYGIEPNPTRVRYARERLGLGLSQHLIEEKYWQESYRSFFDAVTLWDVIEHLDFPTRMLQHVSALLKQNGLLFLDTPARDGFYYRAGELSYSITGGLCPLFLNTMYSAAAFAHKQIFSTQHLRQLLARYGFEVVELRKIHELSFPYTFYLERLLGHRGLARMLGPFVGLVFNVCRIRNKLLVVARKCH